MSAPRAPRGCRGRRVIGLHALRNALIPVITTIGLQVGVLLAGAILTETIFSWPGIGKWMIESIEKRDYFVGPERAAADRAHRDDGEPDRRRALRPDQPAHPAPVAMTDTPVPPTVDPGATCGAASGALRGAARDLVLFPPEQRRGDRPLRPRGARPDCDLRAVASRRTTPRTSTATHFLTPPFWQEGGLPQFILGTDAIGRDMLSRLIHGARYSLAIGLIVVILSLISGVTLGLIAGYFRGWVDALIMRIMDIILAFPSLLLALVLVAIIGPGLVNAMLAIALVLQPHFARLTRAAVMAEKNREYVTGRQGRRRRPPPADVRDHPAQLPRAADRPGDAELLERHPRRRGARLPRHGRPAARAGMGHHACDSREFILRAWWVITLPGPRHPHHRARHQPHRRRPPRRARSEAEAVLMALLEIKNLTVSFDTSVGEFFAVRGIDLHVNEREVLAIVGESGSGKSVAMLAVMGLLPADGDGQGRLHALRGRRPPRPGAARSGARSSAATSR